MSEHKFKSFLVSRQNQWNENQSKNFVDQALTDPDLPDAKSWEELMRYHIFRQLLPTVAVCSVAHVWHT